MPVVGIAFTAYPVSDMAKAQAFYQDVLGLTQAGIASPAWVEYEIGGGTFGIGNFPQLGQPGKAQSLAIEVADMAAYRQGLAEKGYPTMEPYETPVCFISSIQDPDGNSIILHELKQS